MIKHTGKIEIEPVESGIWFFGGEQNPKRVMEAVCNAFELPEQV